MQSQGERDAEAAPATGEPRSSSRETRSTSDEDTATVEQAASWALEHVARMVVGSERELEALAYGMATLRTETQYAAAAQDAKHSPSGPVPGHTIVQGATSPLLVGPGTVLTHVQTFRRVEVLAAWRQNGEEWLRARNGLQHVFSAHAVAFDAYDGDTLSQEASTSSLFSAAQVVCCNPECGYLAHSEVDEHCVFYGYCCGCCRLRHRNEYCVLDHGPRCQHKSGWSLNGGEGAALAPNDLPA